VYQKATLLAGAIDLEASGASSGSTPYLNASATGRTGEDHRPRTQRKWSGPVCTVTIKCDSTAAAAIAHIDRKEEF